MINIRKLHYFSGLVLTVFIGAHLFNHAWSLSGAQEHIAMMTFLRQFYRNIPAEILLLAAVLVQIVSGFSLFKRSRKTAQGFFEKLHLYSGLYLAVFLIFHLSAVFGGRFFLHLDTNFYFGVAGLNTFPFNLFFVPYYGFAVISFFGHIAAIHHKKMKSAVAGISPTTQARAIFITGILFTCLLLFGLTNRFAGVQIPPEYRVLTGE